MSLGSNLISLKARKLQGCEISDISNFAQTLQPIRSNANRKILTSLTWEFIGIVQLRLGILIFSLASEIFRKELRPLFFSKNRTHSASTRVVAFYWFDNNSR